MNTTPIRKGIYLLPNLLTTAALFAGFYAVVAAMDGNFKKAAIGIFVAMFMDGLDGRVARFTGTTSDFGKEYDSLSDMVSFGVAPALVVYQWGGDVLRDLGWLWGKLGWIAAFFYAVSGALRLARFNANRSEVRKNFFQGLPIPSAAALVGGLVWFGSEYELTGASAFVGGFFITAMAGALMVSNFDYWSPKNLDLGRSVPFTFLLVIPAIFMLISLDPPTVLFLMAFTYALSGPALELWRMTRGQGKHPDDKSKAA
jgi:CDP-diacylglycerol--serine O-phosphatidyltransferase